jgi:hypothetical protein
MNRRVFLVSTALAAALKPAVALSKPAPSASAPPSNSAGEPPAPKQKPPEPAEFYADIMVLHATNAKKGVDPRIGSMPELDKPPFSSYDSYELLDRQKLALEREAPRTLKLPNSRILRTQLVQVLSKDTVRLSASINQPNGKEFLPLLEVKAKLGQAFIVAGQSHRQGILVLVIRATR